MNIVNVWVHCAMRSVKCKEVNSDYDLWDAGSVFLQKYLTDILLINTFGLALMADDVT